MNTKGCRHKWYEISREWQCGNRSTAWCELCGELKFTNYQEDGRPLSVLRTPKNNLECHCPVDGSPLTPIFRCERHDLTFYKR